MNTFTILSTSNIFYIIYNFLYISLLVPSANIVWRHCGVLYWQEDAVAGKCVVLMFHAFLCEFGCLWDRHASNFPCMPFPFSNVLLTWHCLCGLILWSACQESTEGPGWTGGRQGPEVTPGSSHFLRYSQPLVLMHCGLSLLLTRRWRYKGPQIPSTHLLHPPIVTPSFTELRAEKRWWSDETKH